MKFLGIAKAKDVLYAMPPAAVQTIAEMSIAAMQQLKKEGKILEYWSSPNGYSVVLLEYKSVEEWYTDLLSIPIMAFCDTENYALTDGFTAFKGLIENLKKMAAMMPAASK